MDRLEAMLATDVDLSQVAQLLDDDSVWLEEKLDGDRILLHGRHDSTVVACNRNGQRSKHAEEFAAEPGWRRFFELAAPHGYGVLDGEYIGGVLHVFDVPYWMSLITPASPYVERRALLDALTLVSSPMRIVHTARTFDDKALLLERCMESGAEGVIFRHIDEPYALGQRSPHLGKLKFTKTVDCRITRVGIDSKANAGLAVIGPHGDDVEIGKASTIGKGKVEVGDIVEVRYLAFSPAGRLVQPRILRVRDDKTSPDSYTKVTAHHAGAHTIRT